MEKKKKIPGLGIKVDYTLDGISFQARVRVARESAWAGQTLAVPAELMNAPYKLFPNTEDLQRGAGTPLPLVPSACFRLSEDSRERLRLSARFTPLSNGSR